MTKRGENISDAWRKLAEKAVARSMAKLARISSGSWALKGVEISIDPSIPAAIADEAGAGVVFTVAGPHPLQALITFRPGDVEVISKCFLGYSFVKMSSMNKAEELLISEVGNIIFNSFLSVMSEKLGESLLPSVPRCIQGGLDFISSTFGESLGKDDSEKSVRILLRLSCVDGETECSVLLVMGGELLARF